MTAGLLSERHRPQHLKDVVGNSSAVREVRAWAEGWAPGRPPPRQRAALLEGPPGVGKTTAALALARDMGWIVVEMNASEARNRAAIELVAGRASLTQGFSESGEFKPAREGGRTLILLDEADCLSGRAIEEGASRPAPASLREFLRGRYGTLSALARAWGLGVAKAPAAFAAWEEIPLSAGRASWTRLKAAQRDIEEWRGAAHRPDLTDRGGLGAMAELVRSTRQPLVITVNDPSSLTRYSPVFRQGVARIRFGRVGAEELRRLVRRIILEEGFEVRADAVEAIVARSEGDVRAALNDLDAIAALPAGPAQRSALGGRDQSSELEEFAAEVLARPKYYRAVEVRNRLDITPEDLFPWFEENAPLAALDAVHRDAALRRLARAELFLSRARRRRVYGLWSYASEVMTGGVSDAIDRPEGARAPRIMFPSFLAGMGRSRSDRQLRRTVLSKLGRFFHLSVRKGNEQLLPHLFRLFDPPRPGFDSALAKAARSTIVRRAGLTAEEVAFLLGREPDARVVTEELDRAQAPPPTPLTAPPTREAARGSRPTAPGAPRPRPSKRAARVPAKNENSKPPTQRRLMED